MTNPAISANGLRKSYGDKTVLDGIDLAVPEGTVFSSSARTGPTRPQPSGSSPPSSPPMPATCASRATTWPPTRRRSVRRSG